MVSILNGVTTYLVGNHYELTGSTVTKYYFAGATRIAMRKYTIPQSMSVEYLLGDHLGSTSLTTDANGAKVSEIRYKPWGEIRYAWTSHPSTTPAYTLPSYTFTGQYSYMDDPTTSGVTEGFGLMFYRVASRRDNARWYDPVTGRFAQADTVVPNTIQGLDRYMYVGNSPLVYTDPTGHLDEDKVKKLLGISGLTEEELAEWMAAHLALWNALLAAEVGDMIVFMTTVNGQSTYQKYIIGESKNGDYVFWGLDNKGCNEPCFKPSHAAASLQEVMSHIASGSEWGFYELDPKSSFGNFTYRFRNDSHSEGFAAPNETIVLENNENWKRNGRGGLKFHRELNPPDLIPVIGAMAACDAGPIPCIFGIGTTVIYALATTTISGPVYYPEYPRQP